MNEQKLDIFIACFAYGGNSGISNEHPSTREWMCETLAWMRDDARVGKVFTRTYNDTPITMLRNRAVEDARREGCQLLLMLDSDHDFMHHASAPWYKPFFPEAFGKIHDHYATGPLVIAAPYAGSANCGENMFIFLWQDQGPRGNETTFSLEQYTRADAALMSGIQPVAALPTGMILYDMRIFDALDVNRKSKRQVLEEFRDKKINLEEALRCIQDGYFYYEWTDHTASDKASTEDVAATRDMSLIGQLVYGYNPVMCAWDSWIGHVKPSVSGKPKVFTVEQIGGVLKRVVLDGTSCRDKIVRVENKNLLKALEEANGPAPA